MVRCVRFLVRGRVQGVWFRASTKAQAIDLGVRGWVRNLPDGSVEVFACGEREALDLLRDWLWQGPRNARVSEVVDFPGEDPPPPDFRVLEE